MSEEYIHGYSNQEQKRLIQQAQYWHKKLILRDLNLFPDEHLLEIGCGVGAVLGIILQAFPNLRGAGIDINPTQIEYAHQHLNTLGFDNVELCIGDAAQLPWADATFDHVYAIWLLEHVSNPKAVLKEAYRVLKPGGKITLTEADYKSLFIWPESPDYQYFLDSLCELFLHSNRNPYIGRVLGLLLTSVGFQDVTNQPLGFYHCSSSENQDLHEWLEYTYSFMEPTITQITQNLGKDAQRLKAGVEFLRSLSTQPESAATVTIYRASGRR